MKDVVAFIAPTVDEFMRQELTKLLYIHGIATTSSILNAALIIADIQSPVERMDIADFAEKLVDDTIQKVLAMNREILSLNQKPKKTKHELDMRHQLKQFNQTKQIYRQRFFNRTQCK